MDIFFEPVGEPVLPLLPEGGQGNLGCSLRELPAAGVEDVPDMCGSDALVAGGGNVGLGILLEMELAALPGDAGESAGQGCADALVVVAGDAQGPVHAPGLETLDESRPVLGRLGKPGGHAQDNPAACPCLDADRDENGAIPDGSGHAHLCVGGIQVEVADRRQGAVSPFLEVFVEPGGALADVGGGDAPLTPQRGHDLGHLAGRDPLEVHFCNSRVDGPVDARTAFEAGDDGLEGCLRSPDLGDVEVDLAGGGPDAPGLESVAVAVATGGALVLPAAQVLVALGEEGMVDDGAEGLCEQVSAVAGAAIGVRAEKGLDNCVECANLLLFGHCRRCCVYEQADNAPNDRTNQAFIEACRRAPGCWWKAWRS